MNGIATNQPQPRTAPVSVDVTDSPGRTPPARLVEPWQALKMNMALLLSALQKDEHWLARFTSMAASMRQLAAHDPDVALYMMMQTAMNDVDHYSAHHAMFCAVVADLCAARFEWPAAEATALAHAALTMNVGMLSLQDTLSKQLGPLSDEQKRRVTEHPIHSVEILRLAGVDDTLWLGAVRRHHKPVLPGEPAEPLQPAQRLAQLLHRVDVFTAKMSRRKSRSAASATRAAKDACLDATGMPDPVGSTILRVLGFYPPGSYVLLANGELAVVTQRGSKAHTPIVTALRDADGSVFTRLIVRDTSNPKYGVKRVLMQAELRMVLNHEKVLGH